MSDTIGVCVHGAGGRMGRAVIAAVSADPRLHLAAATEPAQSSLIGADAGEMAGVGRCGIAVTADLDAALQASALVIDFTRPEGTLTLLDALRAHPVPLITGTTGMDAEAQARLQSHAQTAVVVQAANFSIGVNVCVKLTELAAKIMDEHADVEIVEAHHRHKVDAPSGTALRLGQAVAESTGRTLQEHGVFSRDGNIGARPERAIGFATVRAGDIIGEHTVMFAAEGERVEISHKASSRMNFAQGAVRAALWSQTQAPGLYDMTDVLGL